MMHRPLGAIHRPRPPTLPHLARAVPLPVAKPEGTDWLDGVDLTDFSGAPDPNLTVGCCVEKSMIQIIRVRMWRVAGAAAWAPTAAQIVALYSQLTGYDPSDPATDQGTDTNAAMAWWTSRGIALGNPAADIDVPVWSQASLGETPAAIDMLGPVRITLNLPAAWESAPVSAWVDAPGTGDEWAPGSWGAHSVMAGGQKAMSLNVESWGETAWVHPLALARYWLATDVLASRDWLATDGLAPSGVDWSGLLGVAAQISAT